MKYTEGFRTVNTEDGQMEVYMAAPLQDSESKLPVMIVLQEAFGVNSHIRDICHRFAKEGYIAVSPELFHRAGTHVEVDYSDRKAMMPLLSTMNQEMFLNDLKGTLSFIEELPQVDREKIFSIGFCMGGYVSILASMHFKLAGSISYYGAGMAHPREGIKFGPLINDFNKIQCPVLLFYGAEDQSIPQPSVQEISEKLAEEKKDFRSIVYPDSNHGFFCDQRKSYNAQSAEEAWSLTLEWLKEKSI